MVWRFILDLFLGRFIMIGMMLLFMGLINVAQANQFPVKLGNSLVIIQQQQHGFGKAFVHLHQNETTALKAAQAIIRTEGGSLLTLVHSGQRNIVFYLNHKRYEFDPNRIFTDHGIKKTMLQFGEYTPEAHAKVTVLADTIKRLIPKGKVIAVHNNESYSLNDYKAGHSLAGEAQLLNINHQNFFRNFYLVTQKNDYSRLKKMRFNSVLQTHNATDDGSLSIFLADASYVNVEAGYDQLEAQIKMIRHA